MKSSIVLCYNMNKLIYLLTYVLVCLLVMSVSRAKNGCTDRLGCGRGTQKNHILGGGPDPQ